MGGMRARTLGASPDADHAASRIGRAPIAVEDRSARSRRSRRSSRRGRHGRHRVVLAAWDGDTGAQITDHALAMALQGWVLP
jgi:hypothetical protein